MKSIAVTVLALALPMGVGAASIEDLERELRGLRAQVNEQDRRIRRLEGADRSSASKPVSRQAAISGTETWKNRDNWGRIALGMSRRQVEAILGKPTSVKKSVINYVTLMYQGEKPDSGYVSGNVELDENDRVVDIRAPVM